MSADNQIRMDDVMIDKVEKENLPWDFNAETSPDERLSAQCLSPYLLFKRKANAKALKRRDKLAKKWRKKETERLGNGFIMFFGFSCDMFCCVICVFM